MEDSYKFTEGDWIVHSFHGIGQIGGIEAKGVSGEETRYYRIKTSNSTFWIPADQMDSDVLRPLSTVEEIQQAVDALRKPPKEMSSNFKIRQSRIRRAQLRNTPRAIARLIRDLQARQRDKGVLNSTERSAFRSFKQRLVEEWAIVTDANAENVATRLENLLELHRASVD